jgi:hypothetical protein
MQNQNKRKENGKLTLAGGEPHFFFGGEAETPSI